MGVLGYWLSVAVFVAVFDVWEYRVAFDAVFFFEDDAVHHFLAVVGWLMLAFMATTITPSLVWSQENAILFSALKTAHSSIRLWTYIETSLFSVSKKARRAARPRCLCLLLGYPFVFAVPFAISYNVLSLDYAASLSVFYLSCFKKAKRRALITSPKTKTHSWVAGFAITRLATALITVNPNGIVSSAHKEFFAAKTNVPFLTARYSEWQMLQLGAMVLGFVTVPVSTSDAYGVLVFGYVYVANLNLLAYSMAPERAEDHALVRGRFAEVAWLNFFALGGIALMGISVGLRVHLFFPVQVTNGQYEQYTWVMMFCAFVYNSVMLLQEVAHGGQGTFAPIFSSQAQKANVLQQ